MYNQQKILISHPNSLNERNQSFSPPSTTLTPSSTPSSTPTPSSSSVPTPNIAQIASLAASHMTSQQMVSPFMFQQGINQSFNNGMMNTALYNDPALLQLYFTNLFQGNHGFMPPMYPYGSSYAPYIPGAKNGIPVTENTSTPQIVFKDNLENMKNLATNSIVSPKSNDLEKLVKNNGNDNLVQVILSTPERTKQENIISTDKIEIAVSTENGNVYDTSMKKRRKECSIDSVNSAVETVATETNSNMDECSAKKKSINEVVETRSFENSPEDEADNAGEEDDNSENVETLGENRIESLQSSPQYLNLKSEENKSSSNNFNSSIGGGNSISTNSHEDELFLSNDRKTSFDKIMRIHSSLIGSLSWTVPTDKDDIILKSAKENNGNSTSETSNNNNATSINNNSSSSTNKHDESNKSINQNGQDEYNPFIQRDYNSANVTCFSPRMLPDWQLNWLRDVTRSLSSVPKSPMTGIHFDRTKPAWAVSYYECETRKYYFFFIPDLSEYTIEITLAAAIGCRQNVVARGAHKRKKPGVLTFNLYSGQFEKSNPEAPTVIEGGSEHAGMCNQRFRKSAVLGNSNGCNNLKNQCSNFPISHTNTGAVSSVINNPIAPDFSSNNIQVHPNNHHFLNIFAPNRNHINLIDPSMSALNNFQVTSQMHAHPHAGPAQILFPHMAINGQHSAHPATMASLMHGNPHAMMMDAFQQNALRNASLLYAAALSSSTGSTHNPIPSVAIPSNVSSAIGVATHSAGNIEANITNGGNPVILPSPLTTASTAPTAPSTPTATPTSNTTHMETTNKLSVAGVCSNNIENTNANDTENIACKTSMEFTCAPTTQKVAQVLSSTNENTGNGSIMLDTVALDKSIQGEK
ncbi:hypothetical protein [Cryptosporidium parvum Iowa II]|uniref:Uncharacterized protein n=2 Tax=Cryptosporidium parvum TaxID=5807 RepID=Q5CQ39_CRYPI|nr:hypothetical protein [Cryptosporidium parvum Iowa II]EAK87572.1 hypothetical protein cgd5_4250 [Cryptosporidium parvum Iowa II]QOY41767.1 Uncharacterized protein CPATCC_0025160 [Cryptosporidium parvum]WKS77988.1 hypothetical protein CPCDC_5g4250 [Cryptosporidium sp. 43IA8]WRK32479.1 Uncharacterized protein cpbgf_5004250 [Cryptosporidium parvum]|eukprot:QOY41767.1 hypothetical protein CPATCC_002363 [Cryptosporidium parvum]